MTAYIIVNPAHTVILHDDEFESYDAAFEFATMNVRENFEIVQH